MFQYPWGNLQEMNLDWLIKEWIKFKSSFTSRFSANAITGTAGTDANVVVTEQDNNYNFEFTIPRGEDGATVVSFLIGYQASENANTPPTGAWLATPPTVAPGKYLWSLTRVNYSNGQYSQTYSVARQGVDGAGSPGTTIPLMAGAASVGVSESFAREDHRHPSDSAKLDVTSVLNTPAENSLAPISAGFAYKSIYDVIDVLLVGVDGTTLTFNVSGITADHELIVDGCALLSNPAAVTSNLTVTTGTGTVTLAGTFAGTTDISMTFGVKKIKRYGS